MREAVQGRGRSDASSSSPEAPDVAAQATVGIQAEAGIETGWKKRNLGQCPWIFRMRKRRSCSGHSRS